MIDLRPAARAPLLVLGLVALVAGMLGGMARLGIALPAPAWGVAWHGALMASAFFGTLIALERAVAIGRLWAYAAPAASGAGGVALVLGAWQAAIALFVLGAAVFALASISIWHRHRALYTGVLALGALALLVANLGLAAGRPIDAVALAWIAFFVLTIGGERLELSRLMPVSRAAQLAFAALSIAVLGLALCAVAFGYGLAFRLSGALMFAAAAWLVRHDIATRTVRVTGLTRYIALCLLAGYAWLALGGAVLAVTGGAAGGTEMWDAALHAILIGFVFSMVFGHAPVILPAVLRIGFPYHAALYAPLVLLHATLAVRIAGDLAAGTPLRAAGGAGNAAAIVLFILTAAALVLGGRTRGRLEPARPAPGYAEGNSPPSGMRKSAPFFDCRGGSR
ncbi:MAG: hypothetical protein IT513_11545 [Burkholderiales bacterium]|nr:hypothetical protein [Burkholderiales bacterium]